LYSPSNPQGWGWLVEKALVPSNKELTRLHSVMVVLNQKEQQVQPEV